MRRRLFNRFDARSLRKCAAVVLAIVIALWALSFWKTLDLRLGERYSIHSHHGTVQLHAESASQLRYSPAKVPKVVEVSPSQWFVKRTPPAVTLHLSAWRPYSTGSLISMQSLALPGGKTISFGYRLDAWGIAFWIPATALAMLIVALIVIEQRRRRANAEGHCLTCGYDLRATPGRCPECGSIVPNAADERTLPTSRVNDVHENHSANLTERAV